MFSQRACLAIIVQILVFLAPVSVWSKEDSNQYEVRVGESLGGILFDHGYRKLWCRGCAVDEIANLNSLSNPNLLRVGQILILRKSDVEATASDSSLSMAPIAQPDPNLPADAIIAERPAIDTAVAALQSEALQERATATEENLKSEIVVGLPLHFVAIEGVDRSDQTKGTLLTNMAPGLLLGWRLKLSPNWQTEISTRIEQDEVQPDLNSTNIENREQQIGELALHVRYGSTIRLGLDLRTRDRLVYRAATGPGIRVQSLPTNGAGLSVDADVFQISSASLKVRAGAETILGSSQVETGLAFAGRLIMRQDFENWALEAEAGYENSSYKTTLVEITGSDLWLTWGIVWKL